jgi:hypothetical protein
MMQSINIVKLHEMSAGDVYPIYAEDGMYILRIVDVCKLKLSYTLESEYYDECKIYYTSPVRFWLTIQEQSLVPLLVN